MAAALPRGTVDEIRLLVSELVTNGVKHAGLSPGERIDLDIRSGPARVEGRVRYPEHRGFTPRLPTGPTAGLGLHVVDQIARHWSVVLIADHVEAWFEVNVRA
jgi:two-component sensor histidine kinase